MPDKINEKEAAQVAKEFVEPNAPVAAEMMNVPLEEAQKNSTKAEALGTVSGLLQKYMKAREGDLKQAEIATKQLEEAASKPEKLTAGEALGLGLMQLAITGIGAGVGYASGGTDGALMGGAIGSQNALKAAGNVQSALQAEDEAINASRIASLQGAQEKESDIRDDLGKLQMKGLDVTAAEMREQGVNSRYKMSQDALQGRHIDEMADKKEGRRLQEMQIRSNDAYKKAMAQASASKAAGAANALPPENAKAYEKFAAESGKDLHAWITEGRPAFQRDIGDIQIGINLLASGQNISGPMVDKLPESFKALVLPNGIIARDAILRTVQATLRQTLGAQFTKEEGERIMNFTFDPKVSEQENLRRATSLQNYMIARAENMDNMYKHVFTDKKSILEFKGFTELTANQLIDKIKNEASAYTNPQAPEGVTPTMPLETMSKEDMDNEFIQFQGL